MITPPEVGASTQCPECGSALVSARDAEPWCGQCEWGLDRYDPARRTPELGWRMVDRWTYRLAFRLTRQQFTDLASRPLDGPNLGLAGIVTITLSLALFAGVLALAVGGVWLLVAYPFPAPTIVLGVALLGLAVALRPRFGRLDPDSDVLAADRAPELFALIEQVATAIGAPVPQVVVVDEGFNAAATSVGLRRRRVLHLGLSLWAALDPQERVALLGHELGHFVNGDVRRLLLTQPAYTTLGSAADLVRPVDTAAPPENVLVMLGEALAKAVQWLLSRLLFGAQLLLYGVALRDSQRAEYLADEMAARAAGSAGARSLFDLFLAADSVQLAIRREARAGQPAERWRDAVAQTRAAGAHRLPLLRQLSLRDEVSVFATHPPRGLRHRMLLARQQHGPQVVLSPARNERIDAELAKDYARAARNISWSG